MGGTAPSTLTHVFIRSQDISEVLRAAEEEAACGENKGKEEEEGEKAEEQEGKKADKEFKKFSAAAKDDDKEEEEEEKSLLTSASTEPETPKKGGEQEKEKEGKERGGGGGGEDSGAAGAADSSTKRGVDGAPAATRGEDRREIRVEVPKDDFVLGLADLTGEDENKKKSSSSACTHWRKVPFETLQRCFFSLSLNFAVAFCNFLVLHFEEYFY